MSKTVAVIGGGASGLTAVKCCLDEGLQPTCFERSNDLGGLWNYTDDVREGQTCVMKSTVINTCKEMLSFSDYPAPKDFPIYMHNTYVMKYLRKYAQEFDVTKNVKLETEVLSIKKTRDFSSTGQWNVTVRDIQTGKVKTTVFDAVMVCTGQHAHKHVPTFPGLENFKGQIIHSHDYKNSKGYDNKKIVVIGVGNSGVDAAVELSRVTPQVFISTRRGTWVIGRQCDNGLPEDMVNTTRYLQTLKNILPNDLSNWMVTRKINKKFNHALYALQPNHGYYSQHPTTNDDLPVRIACGAIIVKPNVKRFFETGVEFDDGTVEDNIDVVFLATGYEFRVPFIDEDVLEVNNNKADLFKFIFPPEHEQHTMSFIGIVQQVGALLPIAEMQSRLVARVLKGEVKLPSEKKMKEDIESKRCEMDRRYVKSQRHTMKVDFIPYMDELAKMNNCKPNTRSLLLDPKLAMMYFFGPCTPYQFRLHGHGKWEGAREAVMTQWDRVLHPLRTRPLGFDHNISFFRMLFFFLASMMFTIMFCLAFV